MAQKNQKDRSRSSGGKKQGDRKVVKDDARDEANKVRFGAEPTYGLPAQDLPGAEHGKNVVDSPEQMERNLPQQHGGKVGEHAEGGTRGDRALGDADRHGGRGHN